MFTTNLMIGLLKSDNEQIDEQEIQNEAAKKRLTDFKDKLNLLINAIKKKPSWFTRAAIFWGKLASWQKLSIGFAILAVALPFFIIGILANISALFIMPIVVVVGSLIVGALLENHHNYYISVTNELKEEIFGLGELLNSIISQLEQLNRDFAANIQNLANIITDLGDEIRLLKEQTIILSTEVTRLQTINGQLETIKTSLKETNHELDNTNISLKNTNISLENTNKSLENTNKSLEKTNLDLEKTSKSLEVHTQEQSKLLAEQNEIVEKYQASQVLLDKQIASLESANTDLSNQLLQQKAFTEVLQKTVATFASQFNLTADQFGTFQTKLTKFVENKEASFLEISDRICVAEEQLKIKIDELDKVSRDLEQIKSSFTKILNRGDDQIDRLESSHVTLINRLGLMAVAEKQVNENTIFDPELTRTKYRQDGH